MGQDSAVIYTRLSRARDSKQSLAVQEADCRAWALGRGLDVVQICSDLGRSAHEPELRPGLGEALALILSGKAVTLLVWKLDRLTRGGPEQTRTIIALVRSAGGRVVAVHDHVDTDDAEVDGRLTDLSLLAQAESKNTSLRVASAKARLRLQGRWIGGRPPYGTRNRGGQLVVHPEEAEVVRRVATDVLGGYSLLAIARRLNSQGVPAPRGGMWGANSLAQLLRGPATAGLSPETVKNEAGRYTSQMRPWVDPATGDVVSVMAVGEEPVLSRELQQRVLDALAGRSRPGSLRRDGDGYLLTGRLRCHCCRGRMSVLGRSYCCQSTRTGKLCPSPATAYVAAVDEAVLRAWSLRAGSSGLEAERALAALEQPMRTGPAAPEYFYRLALDADPGSRREAVRSSVREVTLLRGPRGIRFDPAKRMIIAWSTSGSG